MLDDSSERINDVYGLNYSYDVPCNSHVLLSASSGKGRRIIHSQPEIKKTNRRTTTPLPIDKIYSQESLNAFKDCIGAISNTIPFDYNAYSYCKDELRQDSFFSTEDKPNEREYITLDEFKKLRSL